MKPIAYMHMDLHTKFGIPRQSGLVPALCGTIVMEPEYSQPAAFRELESFSHIWLLWDFSEAGKKEGKGWSATVRPPRLGGNRRVGVFASRSPFRPNSIGLSCVKLEAIREENHRILLDVSGIDLMNGTPIYDIKPYLPFADCHPEASEGYTAQTKQHLLQVEFPSDLLQQIPPAGQEAVIALLAQDPRPGYSEDADRIYGIVYSGFDVRFRVVEDTLTVCEIVPPDVL